MQLQVGQNRQSGARKRWKDHSYLLHHKFCTEPWSSFKSDNFPAHLFNRQKKASANQCCFCETCSRQVSSSQKQSLFPHLEQDSANAGSESLSGFCQSFSWQFGASFSVLVNGQVSRAHSAMDGSLTQYLLNSPGCQGISNVRSEETKVNMRSGWRSMWVTHPTLHSGCLRTGSKTSGRTRQLLELVHTYRWPSGKEIPVCNSLTSVSNFCKSTKVPSQLCVEKLQREKLLWQHCSFQKEWTEAQTQINSKEFHVFTCTRLIKTEQWMSQRNCQICVTLFVFGFRIFVANLLLELASRRYAWHCS